MVGNPVIKRSLRVEVDFNKPIREEGQKGAKKGH